ncbi:MAG TPA: GGDEF domain-containing protein [Myxococcales bacterium]|jgi:diguanylate cyclase (GGDEF)-like protein|nr:GGDEF domain-containing protein [Myxococcales bacterium]
MAPPDDRDSEEESQKTRVTRVSSMVTPADVTRAYLIVVAGKSSVGKMFPITGDLVIGRAGSADIVLDDDGVSRRHARVRLLPSGNVEMEDLNSTNGTYFQGERITSQVLKDGDKVQIGSTAVLKFSYQDQLEEALQKNLYESATRDGLTRLYNKKYFQEALEKEFAYADRHKAPLAVVMLDVDHFKKVNDTYGHPAGDYVLQKLAQVILDLVRAEDVVARYGGEEMALILRQSTEEAANRCAERIRSEVAKTDFNHQGTRMPVTVSVGVATTLDKAATSASDLVSIADGYLYRAKRGGRNRVESRKAAAG